MLLAAILATATISNQPAVPSDQLKARVIKACGSKVVAFTRDQDGMIHVTPSRGDSWEQTNCTLSVLQKAGETVFKLDGAPETATKP